MATVQLCVARAIYVSGRITVSEDMGSNILDPGNKTDLFEWCSNGRIGHMGFAITVWKEVFFVSMGLPGVA